MMAFDEIGFKLWIKQSGENAAADAYPIMLSSLEKKYKWDIENMSSDELDDAYKTLTEAIESIRKSNTDKKHINTFYETPRSAFRRYLSYLEYKNSKHRSNVN